MRTSVNNDSKTVFHPLGLHHVFYGEAEGEPLAADDAETLLYLAGPAGATPLNLSPATRTILIRFETEWPAPAI